MKCFSVRLIDPPEGWAGELRFLSFSCVDYPVLLINLQNSAGEKKVFHISGFSALFTQATHSVALSGSPAHDHTEGDAVK